MTRYRTYRTQTADRLDIIAAKSGVDIRAICNLNREALIHSNTLQFLIVVPTGIKLIIPIVEQSATVPSVPWKTVK